MKDTYDRMTTVELRLELKARKLGPSGRWRADVGGEEAIKALREDDRLKEGGPLDRRKPLTCHHCLSLTRG